eukprot:1637029-Alexandrium_andersonii.AAC.1
MPPAPSTAGLQRQRVPWLRAPALGLPGGCLPAGRPPPGDPRPGRRSRALGDAALVPLVGLLYREDAL